MPPYYNLLLDGPCPRGPHPPSAMLQFLRGPLTLNNMIALAISYSVYRSRQVLTAAAAAALGEKPGCQMSRPESLFGLLAFLFATSLVYNFVALFHVHRLNKHVYEHLGGQGSCARRGALTDVERAALRRRYQLMMKARSSLFVAVADVVLGLMFLGIYVLTTLQAKREVRVELGVAYASIGALVAFLFYFGLGVNAVKRWVRDGKERKLEAEEVEVADAKEPLLVNPEIA
ncbi:uncharacterized protein BCR38DRAFT_444413 [Pseudomassariella vexata]|uniref:Uncharacterized protein n=1 Tax=Pseudomassariella vexata TaxID=1141098 RepID=A0A1Y2DNM0_9PEZI|nr:uncharacterized protein BCR38DRAFT_444413 [Pseudomassariella vexata]ORY60255.1 hypothetical protein BCR38DRAFT_444413 [Pseudomassariella vexata]